MTEKRLWESKKALALVIGVAALLVNGWQELGVGTQIVSLVGIYIGGQGYVDAKVRTAHKEK